MSDCPEYYKLADGRELSHLLANEMTVFLEQRVSHYVAHCIISAMEHRYRCGRKEGESQSDVASEKWWLDTARLNWRGRRCQIERIINVCSQMIDYERDVYTAERG